MLQWLSSAAVLVCPVAMVASAPGPYAYETVHSRAVLQQLGLKAKDDVSGKARVCLSVRGLFAGPCRCFAADAYVHMDVL